MSDLKKIGHHNQQSAILFLQGPTLDVYFTSRGVHLTEVSVLRVSPMYYNQTFCKQPPKMQRLSGHLQEVFESNQRGPF